MNRYFCEYKLYNRVNGGWAYQTVKASDDYDVVLKEFHKTCATYIGGDTFSHVCITIEDALGNVLKREVWDMPITVEQTNAEEITEE